ncbi:MAG: twin-arginine translocase TatA/TatE family subunit [Myxococcales bacterium]|nr:twin-arginine translocase TatA/TatE family subunit [Myxococcales bacterium]
MLVAIAIGGWEILIIIAIVLLVFGPSKLPQLGESVGKMLRGFRKEMKALEEDKAAERREKENGEIDVTPTNADRPS